MSITASIRHDISGMSAQNKYKRNLGKLSASLQKLSSGYKINRSADDAAGLAISEKMRMELTGLNQAADNSKDGIRLLQIGEGALDEIHAMLNRLTTLAEQSANGTYQDEIDREELQKELDQLRDEICRIAESTNYNGVELFQDIGYEAENAVSPYYQKILNEINRSAATVANQRAAQSPKGGMTLEQLQRDTKPGELNIIYISHDFDTTQSGAAGGPATGVGNAALDLEVDGTSGKKLSEVLKTAIVPQTVKNILASYPAFGYLNGSSIGIGLRLYNDSNDSAMASVTGGVTTGNMQSYMLSVNIAHITEKGATSIITEANRSKLESTIAHEMIHAFMDEATTAGMFGYNSSTGKFQDTSQMFPSWFIEGMAQTASGPGNWLKTPVRTENEDGTITITRYGGLEIDGNSTEAEIKAAISKYQLNPSREATSASQYGTGYLACMYLGAAVAAKISGNTAADCANAASISGGLNQLLSEIINGSSLNAAIAKYTDFASTADFQTKFNNGTAGGMLPFVNKLLVNTGSGMGGIVTGDLTDADLAENAVLPNIKLFELSADHSTINNIYPAGHETVTGGTTGASGTRPTEFTPLDAPKKEFGDFEVYGADLTGVTFDAGTGTLTVSGAGNVRIKMKSGYTGGTQNIDVAGSGTVTLDSVNVAALNIKKASGKLALTGKNEVNTITMDASTEVAFSGDGQMNAGTFTADSTNTVLCTGGALIVGSGNGTINGTVKVDGASVAANLTSVTNSAGTALEKFEIDWTNDLNALSGSLTSVTVNGVKTDMLLGIGDAGALWLDKKETTIDGVTTYGEQKIVFSGTDNSGNKVSQTYTVKWDDTLDKFTLSSYSVFDVTGGTEGTDWVYDGEKNALRILTDTAITISGGTKNLGGTTDYGTIEIADGVGTNLTLDGVQIDGAKLGGDTAGIKLGNGGTVNLTMKGANTITGSGEAAAIQVFGYSKRSGHTGTSTGSELSQAVKDANKAGLQDSTLNINMEAGSTLTATGGTSGSKGGAGIGVAWATDASKSSINITGEGTITATGGMGGAGIGGSEGGDMKDITIAGSDSDGDNIGLTITTTGGDHGAGIGSGGWVSTYNTPSTQVVGDITITGAVNIVRASSRGHGTGIGSACHSTIGNITIGEDPTTDATVNDKLVINAEGGNDGAAIGSGWSGKMGDLVIWGGKVTANAGARGAGIGSGYEAKGGNGTITIKGGEIVATGAQNASGIGSGMNGSIDGITIEGGTITADGGWTNDGGNIGGFDANGKELKVSIPNTADLSIKAGATGEGLYNTTGSFDGDGDQVYALKVGYINDLLRKGEITTDPPGSTALAFPLTKLIATMTKEDGTTVNYEWDNAKHLAENDVYIWMKGRDVKLTVEYTAGGTNYTIRDVGLKFYSDYGLWRIKDEDLPAEKPQKPGYVGEPEPDPEPEPRPEPDPKPEPDPDSPGIGGIILQIGTGTRDILAVPRFYLSRRALKLDELDISTQDKAMDSMSVIREAINRVSDIRGTYGALSNRLEHNIANLQVTSENLTDSESAIRDADVAKEMMNFVKHSILNQTSQAMLAQCNQRAGDVMQLLQ